MIQYSQSQSDQRQHQLGRKQQSLAIVAVGKGAADEPETDRWNCAEDAVQPQLNRRTGQLIKEPISRGHLHPGADVRDKKADPKKSEIAVAKGGESPDFCRVGEG